MIVFVEKYYVCVRYTDAETRRRKKWDTVVKANNKKFAENKSMRRFHKEVKSYKEPLNVKIQLVMYTGPVTRPRAEEIQINDIKSKFTPEKGIEVVKKILNAMNEIHTGAELEELYKKFPQREWALFHLAYDGHLEYIKVNSEDLGEII